MECNYYSLDECRTREDVIEMLDRLKKMGKLDYTIDPDDILEIEDIELDDEEMDELESFLDDNDVIPYYDRDEDEDDDYGDFYGYDDDNDDY